MALGIGYQISSFS